MPTDRHHIPRNAFTQDFLARLDQIGEPDGAREADVAGPWVVRPVPYLGATGFALLREWESVEAGDAPYAVFRRREMALLAAAVLPASGREPLFRLHKGADEIGFPFHAASDAGRRRAGGFQAGSEAGSAAAGHLDLDADPERDDQAGQDDPDGQEDPHDAAGSAEGSEDAEGPDAAYDPEAADASSARIELPANDDSPPPPRRHSEASPAGPSRSARMASPPISEGPAGHLRDFDEDFAAALQVIAAVVRSPLSLARLLEAAGYVALEQAGRILHRRIR